MIIRSNRTGTAVAWTDYTGDDFGLGSVEHGTAAGADAVGTNTVHTAVMHTVRALLLSAVETTRAVVMIFR